MAQRCPWDMHMALWALPCGLCACQCLGVAVCPWACYLAALACPLIYPLIYPLISP